MDVPGPQRRLAAILAADMVGYSRLMEVDETGTLARLKTHRIELIDPAIAKNRGRIIKTTGDGMLVEFHERRRCRAVRRRDPAAHGAAQHRRRRRRARIQFRIGINLGDVIVEDDDIFGDGVNVAARLEALAEPGGICVSAAVRDQVGERLEVDSRISASRASRISAGRSASFGSGFEPRPSRRVGRATDAAAATPAATSRRSRCCRSPT